jgi:hypothetical protein
MNFSNGTYDDLTQKERDGITEPVETNWKPKFDGYCDGCGDHYHDLKPVFEGEKVVKWLCDECFKLN